METENEKEKIKWKTYDMINGEDGSENDEEDDADEVINNNKLTAYDIAVFYNTYNLSTLLKWWGKKLIVPEFQRSYVWSKNKASEFVDSVLRGLPVPSLFFEYKVSGTIKFL